MCDVLIKKGVTVIRLLQILTENDQRITDEIRQMAGLIAGRYIGGARSVEMQNVLANRWKSTNKDIKEWIKERSLAIMSNPTYIVRSTGASIVARIAIIEKLNNWKILPRIMNDLKNGKGSDMIFAIITELMIDETTHSQIQPHVLDLLIGMENVFRGDNV